MFLGNDRALGLRLIRHAVLDVFDRDNQLTFRMDDGETFSRAV